LSDGIGLLIDQSFTTLVERIFTHQRVLERIFIVIKSFPIEAREKLKI